MDMSLADCGSIIPKMGVFFAKMLLDSNGKECSEFPLPPTVCSRVVVLQDAFLNIWDG